LQLKEAVRALPQQQPLPLQQHHQQPLLMQDLLIALMQAQQLLIKQEQRVEHIQLHRQG
jgi:hypothetical protein